MSVPGSSERKYDASAAQFAQRICVVGIASSIGAPVRSNQSRACRCNGMKIATSWPSFASTFGNEPQTSPNPPVLAIGETSAVANTIFMFITETQSSQRSLCPLCLCGELCDQNRRISHNLRVIEVDI